MAAAAPRSTTTEAVAQGIASSLDRAKAAIQRHGCTEIPIIAEASPMANIADLTVLSAQLALQNNAKAAMMVRRSNKRKADADDEQVVTVGWVVL